MEKTASLEQLEPLIGRWTLESASPYGSVRGQTAFEWLEGKAFVVQRWASDHAGFPDGIAVIGPGDSPDTFTMHYFDSRGVHRTYEMSVRDGTWKVWRDSPGFCQRFTGTFSDDGETIAGRWERSSDGTDWEHDFDLNYSRDAGAERAGR